jgi:AcrR family transcriptional regulator
MGADLAKPEHAGLLASEGTAMADEQPLPPLVARLWGRAPPTRRGPRPGLNLERITEAAIAVADADGLSAVSMSSVAARLGVATMSLYRYVDSKDDLLAAMVEAAFEDPPELDGRSWRDYLTEWTRANRDALLARPWMLPLAHLAPPIGPRSLRWLDRALAALAHTPLTEAEKINAATTLSGYAFFQASLVVGLSVGARQGEQASLTSIQNYGATLAELLDSEHYPALAHAVDSGVFSASQDWVEDTDFLFGLNLVLDGLTALIARRSAGPDQPISTSSRHDVP